jgi:nitroreductase
MAGDTASAEEFLRLVGTARSMRWLKPDPVPDHIVERMLWAATRASNPNNVQAWDFVVVRDAEVRKQLAEAVAPAVAYIKDLPDPGNATDRRTLRGAANLAEKLATFPVIVLICGRNIYPAAAPMESMMYSALFSAAQNLVLAGRALGIGAAYTALHAHNEPEFRRILRIPDDRYIGVTMPIGYPEREFGPVTRRPLNEVVHLDGW